LGVIQTGDFSSGNCPQQEKKSSLVSEATRSSPALYSRWLDCRSMDIVGVSCSLEDVPENVGARDMLIWDNSRRAPSVLKVSAAASLPTGSTRMQRSLKASPLYCESNLAAWTGGQKVYRVDHLSADVKADVVTLTASYSGRFVTSNARHLTVLTRERIGHDLWDRLHASLTRGLYTMSRSELNALLTASGSDALRFTDCSRSGW
jgi:hypothetical protein